MKLKIYWFSILLLSLLIGCSGVKNCEEAEIKPPVYSLGAKINSFMDDFAPVIFDDKLFFTSNRGAQEHDFIDEKNKLGEDLYFSNSCCDWKDPKLVEGGIKSYLNEGTPCFFPDGKSIIVARSYNEGGFGGTDLYSGTIEGNQLNEIKNLGTKINTKYWESQPTITNDGKIIIFVSDRPGGFGGTDLWMSRWENDGWGVPQNLGPNINTNRNELSPFISYDKKLFFASDRSGGKGKLDIYYCDTLEGQFGWQKPKSLEGPFNSDGNDAFPFVTKDGKMIYFASDRIGGCGGFDLYASPCPICEQVKGNIYLAGTIYNNMTKNPLNMEGQVIIKDQISGQIIEKISLSPQKSVFKIQVKPPKDGTTYLVSYSAPGFYDGIPVEQKVIYKFTDQTFQVDGYLDPIIIKPEVTIIFDLTSATIPFFVTGYYRVNTKENLNTLAGLLGNDSRFKSVRYIDKVNKNNELFTMYADYADSVEILFRRYLFDSLLSAIPYISKESEKYESLNFKVIGYADPRGISGKYVEDEIVYKSIKIQANVTMTNNVLSELRAYYTMQYIQNYLRKVSPGYIKLEKENKINFEIEGRGADEKSGQKFDARRRVVIEVRLVNKHE